MFFSFVFLVCLNAAFAQIPVINDGNDATPIAHLKYIASLQLVTTEEEYFCAGVFINRNAVLTLATCFYQKDMLLKPDEVRVVAGSKFRLDKELITYSEVLEDFLIHENFSRSSLENNLAIGFLAASVSDDSIEIINIEDIADATPMVDTSCEIYGWSLTTRMFESPHLLSGEVKIRPKDECNVPTNKISSTTICAGPYFVNGCETDDGSPMVCNKKLHGLIDYRPAEYCSKTIFDRLGTYIDLSEFGQWISEHSQYSSSKRIVTKVQVILLSMFIGKLVR